MDIKAYVAEYAKQEKYIGLSASVDVVHTLINSKKKYAFTEQECYENSEFLPYNIKTSVSGYERDKKVAIEIYKHFLQFLREKGVDTEVQFPPIDISNSFERQMFIAKYFHDPRHNPTTTELSKKLWVSEATIRKDLSKLLGEDNDPIQVCGRKFVIDDAERRRGTVEFASTPHPIFLTYNLSQVIVTLKGLKAMSDNPLYKDYAQSAAADIWGQLSDYAKTRICDVLPELLSENTTWYRNLKVDDVGFFRTEQQCSAENNILDCLKNGKIFYVKYAAPDGIRIYRQCRCLPHTLKDRSIEVECTDGRVHLDFDKVIKTAYTAESLL